MTQLTSTMKQFQDRVNAQLEQHINHAHITSPELNEAMSYGALLGGKRVRPFLVYAVGSMLGSKLETLDPIASSIECIHAYSLIHDDLPAMDDDALRRGNPTCHIKYDEAMAILAGDALQTIAFDILSTEITGVTAQAQLKMINTLARASGEKGMCAGQVLDIAAENSTISLPQLESIHNAKTGALILAAVQMGALTKVDIKPSEFDLLTRFARAIGLAFQVQDDILDITSDTATLGKPQGSDQALNKSTYPALLGLEGAQQKAQDLYQEALHALSQLPYNTQLLELFSHYIIKRDK
ncbi:(2E,6E)-farnesyl diphosphate synthase [Psychromonas sp. 14N.309.X.WAT.B.A12]|jgi:farnesyl diphosphate synthase|uniref:(2E,6E)-farnesyl diphosphate synthase n=1 Tax=unclassified Psychromonas TaxID=2614957 RepID=UPI0025B155F1|nr:(2E,6E)-farnesyl diphosphate synthase [Psychromonas sp. 14N.309.X.WAT.B.A12]MDN2661777.1 (2E,6E)-farnesyl diphosphate synthase [Psychromonas sp. 14N.309.X.WAT.B.A12]